MKKINYILLICIFVLGNVYGQIKLTSISPSVYYTYGKYSNGISSNSVAGYGTVSIDNFNFVSLGLEKLAIDNTDWVYDQYNLSAGFTKNLYPIYLTASFMHVDGKFSLNDIFYKYNDHLNIYNIGFAYNYKKIFVAGSYSYLDLNGFKSLVNRQYELKFTWLATDYLTLSVKPVHSNLSDGRELYSIGSSLVYYPIKKFVVTLSGFAGERAYYFNNELLTVFNQDETQKSIYEIKVQYNFSNSLQAAASFQQTKFDSYNINYFTLGIKAFL